MLLSIVVIDMVISKNTNGLFVDSFGKLYSGIAYSFYDYSNYIKLGFYQLSDFNSSLPQVIASARQFRRFNRDHLSLFDKRKLKELGYSSICVFAFVFDDGNFVSELKHCFFSCPLF